MGRAVGINTFSLQNLYANRLVRCYLGASKTSRNPEPVVNMDFLDDYEMSALFPGKRFDVKQLLAVCQRLQRKRNISQRELDQYNGELGKVESEMKKGPVTEGQSLKANSETLTAKRDNLQKDLIRIDEELRKCNEELQAKILATASNSELNCDSRFSAFWGPIHIVNGALNQKASAVRADSGQSTNDATDEERRAESLQFLERQAESFVFTPLYCGSEATGYCPSHEFAGDVKLGTAVAVSGAAVSPNMGYHSSPAVTALLTVFNVRLGSWFGNPCRETRKEANPAAGSGLLLAEMAGVTDAESDYVYVSDGGHFENMGVYELIRRRCRFIVAVDAGADPKFHENVGRVVRQVRIDFGIWIEVDMAPVTPGPNGLCASHVVVGRIHYGDVHRPQDEHHNDLPEHHPDDPTFSHSQNHGLIIWFKNSLTGDEPGDLVNHAAMCPTFPYDSTVDQFFSEPQFESYRALGLHSILKSWVLPNQPSDPTARETVPQCVGSAPVTQPTRNAKESVMHFSTNDLFQSVYNFWLTKPAQFVAAYVQENDAYAKIQSALRQDKRLIWLAKELYGSPQDIENARGADRRFNAVAERLMANEMFTLLENVFLALDLERNYLHPVHSGWMNVFKHWVRTDSLWKAWGQKNELLQSAFSPAFIRFVNQVPDQV